MQIQMGEGAGLRRGEGVPTSTADDAVRAEMGCGDRASQRSVVERAARKNLFRGEAEGYGVRQARRVFRVEESGFMRQRSSGVENEVGCRRR
jgi:hypothetical protein